MLAFVCFALHLYDVSPKLFCSVGVAGRENNLVLFRKSFYKLYRPFLPFRVHIDKAVVKDKKALFPFQYVVQYGKPEGKRNGVIGSRRKQFDRHWGFRLTLYCEVKIVLYAGYPVG